jgi:hypothetical protein
VTWQSGEVLWAACVVAAVLGFVVNRWWSIAATVFAWLLYVELIYPFTTPTIPLEGKLQEILSMLVLVHVFATTWLVGIATASGFGCRLAISRKIAKARPRTTGS